MVPKIRKIFVNSKHEIIEYVATLLSENPPFHLFLFFEPLRPPARSAILVLLMD